MGLLIGAAALIFGFGTAYVASEDIRYLTRAGIEETRLLTHRVPINHIAHDPKAPDSLRAMAGLVVEVRTFAKVLKLEAKETYTSYSDVGRDTLLLVLTASPRSCICPVTWKYPIAGRIPYKGFFDFKKAQQTAADYAKQGYDVNLRPSAAFSTLGWFNDPLLSTALTKDSMELAATVFHEIAHNTLWIKGATDFNESFAQWVAYKATEKFFLVRRDTVTARRAAQRWRDEMLMGDYYERLMARLDSLYALKLPAAANDSGRAVIARWSKDTLENVIGPKLRTYTVGRGERPINNAALIGVRLYRTNLRMFDDWGRSDRNDLEVSLYRLREILNEAEGADAFKRMAAMLRVRPPPPDTTD